MAGHACIAGAVFVFRSTVGSFLPGTDHPHTTSVVGPRGPRSGADTGREVFAGEGGGVGNKAGAGAEIDHVAGGLRRFQRAIGRASRSRGTGVARCALSLAAYFLRLRGRVGVSVGDLPVAILTSVDLRHAENVTPRLAVD